MSAIKIKSSVKSLEVEWPNGKKSTYLVDVGQKEVMKSFIDKAESLNEKVQSVTDSTSVDELWTVVQEMFGLIDLNIWKDVKKRSKGSIFAIGQVLGGLTKLAKEGFEEGAKLLG